MAYQCFGYPFTRRGPGGLTLEGKGVISLAVEPFLRRAQLGRGRTLRE
jgi:hypothetical protein